VFTVANTPVGAPGGVAGTTAAEGDDTGLGPALFCAVTVNVYATPLVRPVTVQEVVMLVQVLPPGLAVTV
jgi:hypothetical protein